jgi:hypothetical protein
MMRAMIDRRAFRIGSGIAVPGWTARTSLLLRAGELVER